MEKLFDIIEKHIINNKKVIIAIDGPSSSGKTTLGNLLKDKYEALLFHTDDYFLHPTLKTKERLAESGGNLDYERLQKEVFDNLTSEYIQSNHFNCSTNILEMRAPLKNNRVIIVEGAYSMHNKLFHNYTFTVFLQVSKEEQLKRILNRNGEKMLKRFISEWIPLENSYFERENLLAKCDIVLSI